MQRYCVAIGGAIALTSCSPPEQAETSVCDSNIRTGTLVITEIFADAKGADTAREWFEFYNTSAVSVDISGLVLTSAREDGSSLARHRISEGSVAASDYFVVGNAVSDDLPEYVDYSYGDDLNVGSSRGLPNTSGQIALRCNGDIIDVVVYQVIRSGVSLQFDGAKKADALGNDNADGWCASKSRFEVDGLGTPGVGNTSCDRDGMPQCQQDGQWRLVRSPKVGDVVITEYMARPALSRGSSGEWLELKFLTDVDGNGLQFGRATALSGTGEVRGEISTPECLIQHAGSYLVIAGSLDATKNGGINEVVAPLGFGVIDRDGGLFVAFAGEILDVVTYSTQRPRGVAMALDGSFHTPAGNDEPRGWCAAMSPYGLGDLGTPGRDNPKCDIVPVGQCRDENSLREIIAAGPGMVRISEYMARPNGIGAADGEWIELEVLQPFDLNGLQLGRAEPEGEHGDILQTVTDSDCLPVSPGEFIVLARNVDVDSNGGVEANKRLEFPIVDSADGLFIGAGGDVIDVVTWTAQQKSGRSQQRNDEFYCTTSQTNEVEYAPNNFGTPGHKNICPAE